MLETRGKTAEQIASDLDYDTLESAVLSNSEVDFVIRLARASLTAYNNRVAELQAIIAKEAADIKIIEDAQQIAQVASLNRKNHAGS